MAVSLLARRGLLVACRVARLPEVASRVARLPGHLTVVSGCLISKCGLHDMSEPAQEEIRARCPPELSEKARTSPELVTEQEWKQLLSSVQFQVARQHGTERAWSGRYNDNKEKGTYQCVCCGTDLFSSTKKFDSGSGWPSFVDTVRGEDGGDDVVRKVDYKFGMKRTEVLCKTCQAHLGHVFPDGPGPTGLRYCINSASLNFVGQQKEE